MAKAYLDPPATTTNLCNLLVVVLDLRERVEAAVLGSRFNAAESLCLDRLLVLEETLIERLTVPVHLRKVTA